MMAVYEPQNYGAQLVLMLGSMLSWGSWASTLKLTPGWAFQLFYWDYVLGVLAGSIAWGFALGGGIAGFPASLIASDMRHLLYAVAAGIVFNLANQLLVAAIDIAGLAVAFPVGIGIALILGVALSYAIAPIGNSLLLFGGVVFVLIAIAFDAIAYRRRDAAKGRLTATGLILSVASGLLMGLFYPVLTRAMEGPSAFTPYAAIVYFAVGVALCAVPVNYGMMRRPVTGGAPLELSGYAQAKIGWHAAGMLGGAVWCSGAVFNVVASRGVFVGPAISYAVGQGATMITAVWGVFVWKEFKGSPGAVNGLLTLMFLTFLIGLTLIALAPRVH
jgi:glucose uptake protein